MDSLIAENFIFDSTLDNVVPDGDRHLIIQKNVAPYLDQNRGNSSYANGKIIIDAQTGNGSDFNDYSNAYITLPYELLVVDTAGGIMTAPVSALHEPSLLTALKNECLIDNIRVEQAGRTIVSESQNLSHLINFVKHCTATPTTIGCDTRVNKYSPDGCNMTGVSVGLAGVVNNINTGNDLFTPNTSVSGVPMNLNAGLLDRQLALFPQEDIVFSTQANKNNENLPIQMVKAYPALAVGATTISNTKFLAVIYLRDLSDFFKKSPLSKGGYKITLTVNQAVTTFAATGSTLTPFQNVIPNVISTITSGSANPMMLCVGSGTSAAGVAWGGTPASHQITCTARIDSTSPLQTGVTLFVPSYTMDPDYVTKLNTKSIVHRSIYMVNSAVYTNQGSGAPVNIQLFSAISNPRTLIVIPQYTQTTGFQTQPSQCSIYNTCPGTSDPYLSLTRVQVRINGKGILPSPINYGYQQFIENTSRIFKLNGGQSDLTTGIISMTKFTQNYRYYAFDLDLIPKDQIDIPQIITFEGFNNSAVNIDLYCFVLYKADVNYDLLNGSIEMK